MRGKYAEIADSVWNNALDYGQGRPDPESYKMPDMRTAEEKDNDLKTMVERQNARFEQAERLRLAEQGKKMLRTVENETQEKPKELDLEQIAKRSYDVGQQDGDLGYYRYLQRVAQESEISGAELLRNVRERNKNRLFGKDRDMKFYCAMDEPTAMRMLRAGEMDSSWYRGREAEGAEPRLMHFAYDHRNSDGTYTNGFVNDHAEPSRDVTFVLDGKMIDEPNFECGTKYPTIDKLNLQKYCLGVVTPDPDLVSSMIDVAQSNQQALPVYLNEDGSWDNRDIAYDTEGLRKNKQNRIETVHQRNELKNKMRKQIFENVDKERIVQLTNEFLEKLSEKQIDQMIDAYVDVAAKWRRRSETEREQMWYTADQKVLKIISESLNLTYANSLAYVKRPDKKWAGLYRHRPKEIVINRAHIKPGDVTRSIETIAHELWHGRQHEEANLADGQDDSIANLYKLNYREYIKLEVDRKGYQEQLVEVEASDYSTKVWRKAVRRYDQRFKGLKGKIQERRGITID